MTERKRPSASGAATASEHKPVPPAPAKITLLYESRDKKLCLFEDGHGHLTAVRAARLA